MGLESKINGIQLEICSNSPQSALYAAHAGATRVELCQNLENGGTTPSYAQIRQTRELISIGIHVLIRPRAGDFLYSELEFKEMLSDIQFCKKVGCDGVVIGLLNIDGTIDIERTEQLVKAARPMHVTFHRAFDKCLDPFIALDELIALGVDRVLTSGLQNTALEGLNLLTELIDYAQDKITIMPGAGVNALNIEQILVDSKAIAIHSSAKVNVSSAMTYDRRDVAGMNEAIFSTSLEKVQELIEIIKKAV